MKKGALLITKSGHKIYQIIGRWDTDIVLMPTSETDEQVLIYGSSELEGLVKEGYFRILHEMLVKGGQP